MAELTCGIGSVADQRYYHFLLWKVKREPAIPVLWRRFGDIVEPALQLGERGADYQILHKKLKTERSYARAGIAEILSENGDGRAPFYYDLFVIRVAVDGASYLLVGFPFVNLVLEILGTSLGKYRLKEEWEQQCVYVPRLLPILEDDQPSTHKGLSTRVVGVQWSVQSDASLTSIRLGGDSPLKADLYVSYLRPLAQQKESSLLPERCSLAFERSISVGGSTDRDTVRTLVRSRLHVDLDGGFRFYAQVGCRNIGLLPYAVRHLWSLGCLDKACTESPMSALRAGESGE